MRKFTLYILLFSLPLWVMVAVYVLFDPFKVIRTYSNYKAHSGELSVPLNQDHVSTATFLFYNPTEHYNAFILGSSRSMFYEVSDWKTHIGNEASCFHFDASSETIEGITHKVDFIDQQGCEIRHALLILDESTFLPRQLLNDHLYLEDPRLCAYRNAIEFQSAHFLAFLNRKFLRAYLDYRFNGEARPYMTENMVLDNRPFVYDPISNELRFEFFEHQMDSGKYYTPIRMQSFYDRSAIENKSRKAIDASDSLKLSAIAEVFKRHKTDFYIIISPLYDQRSFSDDDIRQLRSVFGEHRIFDFSGVNEFTSSYTNYYERSHYRPHVAKAILDSIYHHSKQ